MKFRAKVIMTFIFVILFTVVAGNFFRISVLNNKKYQEMANDQHFGSIVISANRGSIYDAKGTPLAKSATVYKLIIDPKKFREELEDLQSRIDKRNEAKKNGTYQPEFDEETGLEKNSLPESAETFKNEAVALLSEKLGIAPEKVQEAMLADTQWQMLQDQVEKPVSDEVLAFFTKYGFISVNVEEDTKRYYPQNELAASVIGFTGSDGYGIYGLEASYDEYLAGIDGRTISAKDSNGNALPYRYSKTYPAQDGDDVYLTLDMNIQYILEKHLQEMVTKNEVKNRGCAILMNAKTGAIYGMATYPSFDLNSPMELADPLAKQAIEGLTDDKLDAKVIEEREKQWRNKCISERYEPGSVFKVITSASAIEENLIDFDAKEYVCNGKVDFPGVEDPVYCWERGGHGAQTFQEALTHSCNPAFMTIGAKLGIDKFLYYFDAFGMREPTGIDLPAEANGYNKDKTNNPMRDFDLAICSFGQCETVTPIEMLVGGCATINGGYLLQPYVVDKVLDEDGNVVKKNERTVRRQVISEETSAKMRECLENVVTGNNGGNVTIKGYSIGGKSGTSQRLSETRQGDKEGTKQEYGASYLCFTPADDPEIILLVLADMPNEQIDYYGSKVAVPCARDILTEVLPYMGISPQYSESELANLDVKVPLLEGSFENAKTELMSIGLEPQRVGDGATVVAQCPEPGETVAKGGTVYLYTDPTHTADFTTVPDLRGLDPQVANDSLIYCNLNYVSRGASIDHPGAVVNSQSIEPNTKVPNGTVIELEFIVDDPGD